MGTGLDQKRLADALSARRDLSQRAEHLTPGHPSSPWDDSGQRRPPERPLTDYELPDPPLTDAQWTDHVADVVGRIDRAGTAGLTTELLHTTDPDHRVWSPDRNRLHALIIEGVYAKAAHVPCERLAIMAGGLGGAGKTTVIESHAGIDRARYLTINPDEFKEELAMQGALPHVEGLSPMEASALAHAESSYLARVLATKALAEGKNVIWDITMSSVETASRRIGELRGSGCMQIDAIFVDIPPDVSVSRADARHRHGHEQFLAGIGLGGRCLVADVIRSRADPDYGSVNRRVFEVLKERFDRWVLYDNSVDGRPPKLVESSNWQGLKEDRR